MNNIATRTVWGGLFVAIIMASLFVSKLTTVIILGVFMLLSLVEFHKLFKNKKDIQSNVVISLTGGIALYTFLNLSLHHYISLQQTYLFILFFLFIPLLGFVFSRAKNPLLDVSIQFFAWIYVCLPFFIMNVIYASSFVNYQWEFLLGLFILVWANDTFAFLFGLGFGKHKLIERISPKKTWEGAIGGFLSTILFSLLYSFIVGGDYIFWIFASIIISPTSIFGDLIESKIKRIVNIKDTGSLIPGHGGILDRFDAVMYAAPFFYLYLALFYA